MLQSTLDVATEVNEVSTSLYSNGARAVAVRLLTRVQQSDAYLDKLLDRELRRNLLNAPDKRLLTELTTGVLRHRGRLDWILTGFYRGDFNRCMPVVGNALRVALYQILFLDRIPHSAAVNEAVEMVKQLKGARYGNVVNGVLRSILRKLNAVTYPDPDRDPLHYLSVYYSHPLWIVERWEQQFGRQATEALLNADNNRPVLSLRVNLLKASPEDVARQLRDLGLEIEPGKYLSSMLRARTFPGLNVNEAFLRGLFTVQDEGAALAARLTDVRPGMRVIDLCAAPGGKSALMAEMMENRGDVIAVDRYEAKLPLIAAAAERLGLADTIHPLAADARTFQTEPADVVLVDAPCSGFGVLAKKPEIKWRRRPEEIEELAGLQSTLLNNAARLVKPGGALVYTTCTIEPKENAQVVHRFLKEHPEFRPVPADMILPGDVVTPEGFLETLPHIHETDGAFGARMVRVGT